MPIIHIIKETIKDTVIKSYTLTGKPVYCPEVAHMKLLPDMNPEPLIRSTFIPTGKELSLTVNHKKIISKL